MMSLDRRRAMGPYLWLAALGVLLLYLHSVSYLLRDDEGDALMAFFLSISVGYAAPILPLMAALPFGTAFCADWQSSFAPAAVTRSGRRRYLMSKALASALSGALVSALGMLLFILVLNLRFPPDFGAEPFLGDVAGLQHQLAGGGAGAYLSYYGSYLFLALLSGMFWAMSALTFSAFYPNVALTLCAPLVLHRLMGEVGNWVYIPRWMNVTLMESGAVDMPPPTLLTAGAGVFVTLTALMAALFMWRAGRRLRHA